MRAHLHPTRNNTKTTSRKMHTPYPLLQVGTLSILAGLICFLVTGCASQGTNKPDTLVHYALVSQFEAKQSTILSLAWSPDGKQVALGTVLWPLNIWDLTTRKVSQALVGGSGMISSVSWSRDGNYVAANSIEPDVTLRVWSVATGQLVFSGLSADRARSVAWSNDSKNLAVSIGGESPKIGDTILSPDSLGTEAPNSKIQVYSGGDWQVQATLPLTTYSDFVSWSPDNKQLAFIETPSFETTSSLAIWDPTENSITRHLVSSSYDDYVTALSWSPKGALVAVANNAGQVALWDPNMLKQMGSVTHGGRVLSLAWSSDGKFLASGGDDRTVKIWEIESKKLIGLIQHMNSVDSIQWSPDGHYLASGGHDDTLNIWDMRP